MDLMEEYITECQLRKLSPRTIIGYRKLLSPALIWIGDNERVDTLEELTPQHFKKYLMYKQQNDAKPQYLTDILRVMRTFSAFLYREGYTNRLIAKNIRNIKQPRVKIFIVQKTGAEQKAQRLLR